MARQWFIPGVGVVEEDEEEEYFLPGGGVLSEDQPPPVAGDLDTAEKRGAASALLKFKPGITPNAAKDEEWRHQVARVYSGLVVESAAGMVFRNPVLRNTSITR